MDERFESTSVCPLASGEPYWRKRRSPADQSAESPAVSFELEFDLEHETAIATYGGDDPVPAHEYIVVDGDDLRDPLWIDLTDRERIEPGEAVTIDLKDGDAGGRFPIWSDPEERIVAERTIPDR